MPRILLPTFLRNSCCDSVEKANRLGRYAEPSKDGHDHYWSLKDGAKRVCLAGQSFDEACEVFGNMTDQAAIADNKAALLRMYQWRLKNKGKFFEPPKGSIAGPLGQLIVKLEPEFGFIQRGKRKVIQIWTSRTMQLPPSVAGMGVLALELGLKSGEWDDCEFYVLNLDIGKKFGPKSVTTNADVAFAAELAAQELMYVERLKKKKAEAA